MFKNEKSTFGTGFGATLGPDGEPVRTKLDTFAEITYYIKLAQDPKVYTRDDASHDVVLTFCDSSRFDTHEDMWVDARVVRGQSDRAKKFRKGDMVQVKGKLRFKRQEDGKIRGKIFDAVVYSFQNTSEREEMAPQAQKTFE